jgi:hypothetical protein
MVHDAADVARGPRTLDSVRVAFDERRLVSDAGLEVTATLAQRLGIGELHPPALQGPEVCGSKANVREYP